MNDAHLGVRLARACSTYAERPATRLGAGDDWAVQTYAEFGERVRALAARFVAAGIRVGDRVCLFSRNHPDWSAADAALLTIRAVPVPVYPTADWHERETWDFFGIVFDGHPALTRIEMPDDWPGHPQRKDYPLGGIPIEYKGTTVPPVDQRRSYR